MPSTSLKVLKIFDIIESDISIESVKNDQILKPNTKINKIDILFKKIENEN